MKYHITAFWLMLIALVVNIGAVILSGSHWTILNAFMAGLLISPLIDSFKKGYLEN